MASSIQFGAFEADRKTGELRKHGVKIRLADQPFAILICLLERPGEIVTRDELRSKLWAVDTFVDSERGLNKAINRLRDALGDSAAEPSFIETLPKRGYRFVGQVKQPKPTVTVSDTPSEVGTSPFVTVPPSGTVSPPIFDEADGSATRGDGAQDLAKPRKTVRLKWRYLAAVSGLAIVVAAIILYPKRPDERAQDLVRSSLLPPPNTLFLPYNFALSPDGSHLAFVAVGSGKVLLWIRPLSAAEAFPLNGTEGASLPFWCPDNRHVGFFADRKLKTIEISEGSVRTLTDAPRPAGGTWSPSSQIVFSPDANGPLYRISSGGGATTAATVLSEDGESHRWPFFLPDGKTFLFVSDNIYSAARARGIFTASTSSVASRRISTEQVRNAAFALHHIFFVKSGNLTRQQFEPETLNLTGDPVPVLPGDVADASRFFPSGFSIANTGLLAFQSNTDLASRMTWMKADGTVSGELPDEAYNDPSVSPDGRSIAISCDQRHNGQFAICVYDVARRITTRVTNGPNDRYPVWAPDGSEVAYMASDGMYRVTIDGSRHPQLIRTNGIPTSWSRAGSILFFGSEDKRLSIGTVSLVDKAVTKVADGVEGQFSPNGKWIAYNSPDGIVVRRYPGPGRRVQIATYGGHQPRWSRDGKRLFYIGQDKELMAVDFDADTETASAPRELFRTRIVGSGFTMFQFDVMPDGRFLVNSLKSPSPPLTLVTGWNGVARTNIKTSSIALLAQTWFEPQQLGTETTTE